MIRFRAWNKGKEYYLYDVQDTYDTNESCFGDFLFDNERYAVEQFTGLTDVNGKDVYENDILRLSRNEPKIYIYDDKDNLKAKIIMPKTVTQTAPVTNDAGTFGVSVKGVFLTLREVDKGQQNIKVISNVHTSPELLEEYK